MVCCISCCTTTILLVVLNIIIALAGGFLVFVGAVIQWNITEFGQFIPDSVSVPGYLLIAVGIGLIVIGLIGFCCSALPKWLYIIFLLILVVLEATGGILAFTLQGRLEGNLITTMKDTMALYTSPNVEGELARQTWDLVQTSFHCCGVNDSSDWNVVIPSPPPSCACKPDDDPGLCNQSYYREGCYAKVSEWFKMIESALGYIALSFAGIHLGMAIVVYLVGRCC